MMINRNVRQRVAKLADFIEWDSDPYLVVTDEGRLVWMIDGYTASVQASLFATSAAWRDRHIQLHPQLGEGDRRRLRRHRSACIVFDTHDPIIRAWQAMFPALFKPSSEMPGDSAAARPLSGDCCSGRRPRFIARFTCRIRRRSTTRRTCGMSPRTSTRSRNRARALAPTYVVATLPGESQPEFLLLQSFTPRSKDNLIGVMAARCDPAHYGELVVLAAYRSRA